MCMRLYRQNESRGFVRETARCYPRTKAQEHLYIQAPSMFIFLAARIHSRKVFRSLTFEATIVISWSLQTNLLCVSFLRKRNQGIDESCHASIVRSLQLTRLHVFKLSTTLVTMIRTSVCCYAEVVMKKCITSRDSFPRLVTYSYASESWTRARNHLRFDSIIKKEFLRAMGIYI